jgi:hypothetical protein
MHRASITFEACRVWALILQVGTPAWAALVASPARRLWPVYGAGSNPAAATLSRTTSDTAFPDRPGVVDVAMTIYSPQYRPLCEPGIRQPRIERGHGAPAGPTVRDADLAALATLVGSWSPQVEDDPLPDMLDIPHAEPDQLWTSERPSKAKSAATPDPDVLQAVAHGVEHASRI